MLINIVIWVTNGIAILCNPYVVMSRTMVDQLDKVSQLARKITAKEYDETYSNGEIEIKPGWRGTVNKKHSNTESRQAYKVKVPLYYERIILKPNTINIMANILINLPILTRYLKSYTYKSWWRIMNVRGHYLLVLKTTFTTSSSPSLQDLSVLGIPKPGKIYDTFLANQTRFLVIVYQERK